MAKGKKDEMLDEAMQASVADEATEANEATEAEDAKVERVIFEAVCIEYVVHNKITYAPGDSIELTNQEEYKRLLELNVAE